MSLRLASIRNVALRYLEGASSRIDLVPQLAKSVLEIQDRIESRLGRVGSSSTSLNNAWAAFSPSHGRKPDPVKWAEINRQLLPVMQSFYEDTKSDVERAMPLIENLLAALKKERSADKRLPDLWKKARKWATLFKKPLLDPSKGSPPGEESEAFARSARGLSYNFSEMCRALKGMVESSAVLPPQPPEAPRPPEPTPVPPAPGGLPEAPKPQGQGQGQVEAQIREDMGKAVKLIADAARSMGLGSIVSWRPDTKFTSRQEGLLSALFQVYFNHEYLNPEWKPGIHVTWDSFDNLGSVSPDAVDSDRDRRKDLPLSKMGPAMLEIAAAIVKDMKDRLAREGYNTNSQPAPRSGEFGPLDDVKGNLKRMKLGPGGRVRAVDFDGRSTWEIEPTDRQRLDHYGNDGDGWDEEGWREDYAYPMEAAARKWLNEAYAPGVFQVEETGEKGHLYVSLTPKGKNLFTA